MVGEHNQLFEDQIIKSEDGKTEIRIEVIENNVRLSVWSKNNDEDWEMQEQPFFISIQAAIDKQQELFKPLNFANKEKQLKLRKELQDLSSDIIRKIQEAVFDMFKQNEMNARDTAD